VSDTRRARREGKGTQMEELRGDGEQVEPRAGEGWMGTILTMHSCP
jgi:hypothetical protein